MAYYYDHKAEMDQSFRDDEEFVNELKAKRGSLLERLPKHSA
jgi:hypothetical protein